MTIQILHILFVLFFALGLYNFIASIVRIVFSSEGEIVKIIRIYASRNAWERIRLAAMTRDYLFEDVYLVNTPGSEEVDEICKEAQKRIPGVRYLNKEQVSQLLWENAEQE